MEITFITLVFCYGVCFGLQNKVAWLYGKSAFTDKLLQCSYCLGFHCGWIAWIMTYIYNGVQPMWVGSVISSVLVWAFTSSAFCYVIDTCVRWVEMNTVEE